MKRILHMALLGAAALGLNAPMFCNNNSPVKIKHDDDDEQPVVAYLASEETNLETYINQVSQKEKPDLKTTNDGTKCAEVQKHYEPLTKNKNDVDIEIVYTLFAYTETETEQTGTYDQQNESITLPDNQEVKLDPKLAGNFNKNNRVHLFLERQSDKSPRHIATWNNKKSQQVIGAIKQSSETNTNAQDNNNSKATSSRYTSPQKSFLAGYCGFFTYWLVNTANVLTGNPIGRFANRRFPGFVELLNNAFGRNRKHLVGSFTLGTAVGTAVYLGSTLKTWFDEAGPNSRYKDSDPEGEQ